MTFESEKTGQYLRAKALKEGAEDRVRALQALNHGYGTGSHAALAKMLLATLGGKTLDSAQIEDAVELPDTVPAVITQVAHSMQQSANDSDYQVKEASSQR